MNHKPFKLPKASVASFNRFFREATRGGGVPTKVVEDVYHTAEESSGIQHMVPGRLSTPAEKRSDFITHELVERLVLQKFGGRRTTPLGVTKEQLRAAHQFAATGERLTRHLRTKMNLAKLRRLRHALRK